MGHGRLFSVLYSNNFRYQTFFLQIKCYTFFIGLNKNYLRRYLPNIRSYYMTMYRFPRGNWKLIALILCAKMRLTYFNIVFSPTSIKYQTLYWLMMTSIKKCHFCCLVTFYYRRQQSTLYCASVSWQVVDSKVWFLNF